MANNFYIFYQSLFGNSGKVNLTMANNQRPVLVSPSTCRCMHIWATYSTCNDFHIDIIISPWFRLELRATWCVRTSLTKHVMLGLITDLDFLWTVPLCCRLDCKPFERIWIHGEWATFETAKVLNSGTTVKLGRCTFYVLHRIFAICTTMFNFLSFTRLVLKTKPRVYLEG
jgi:hypothetical protein